MTAKLIIKKTEDIYCDGDIEKKILKIVTQNKNQKKTIEKILNNNPEWPLRYHFSPTRKNILDWYSFNSESTLLEVGAGCGAITEIFCQKLKQVTAIELSETRSKIIFNRFKKYNNLTIISGNLNDIDVKEKFDYITLIGVLEYAGKYTHTSNPYQDFLKKIKSKLKKNGVLIIAIENKYGLKYWSGCKEDHTGTIFDSIEDYSNYQGIRTFSKKEITNLLKKTGFKKNTFYYPLPDYKLPSEIFSDQYLPNEKYGVKNGLFPYQDYSQEREYLFNEQLVLDNLIKNDQFSFFSNSFLIFCQK